MGRTTLKFEHLKQQLGQLAVPQELLDQLMSLYKECYKEAYKDGREDLTYELEEKGVDIDQYTTRDY